jgi:hypothetical protein
LEHAAADSTIVARDNLSQKLAKNRRYLQRIENPPGA